jgi:hypothetical protein
MQQLARHRAARWPKHILLATPWRLAGPTAPTAHRGLHVEMLPSARSLQAPSCSSTDQSHRNMKLTHGCIATPEMREMSERRRATSVACQPSIITSDPPGSLAPQS